MVLDESQKARILIIDDSEENRVFLGKILSNTYEISFAENGAQALGHLYNETVKPDLILLKLVMPVFNGYDIITALKRDKYLNKVPLILITTENGQQQPPPFGTVDCITTPFNPKIVQLRVGNHLELGFYRNQMETLVKQKVNSIQQMEKSFLETMANLIEYRSLESGEHVMRTRELTRMLIMQLLEKNRYVDELETNDYNLLIKAVPLHDIGKIAIPDHILLKPGRLTTQEFDVIKTHPIVGAEIIQSLFEKNNSDPYLLHCLHICSSHHEKYDGSGYPRGLSGNSIPLAGRIVCIVDVYDALVAERCYKKVYTHAEALQMICESSGQHFDPLICETFYEIEAKFKYFESSHYISNLLEEKRNGYA